MSEPLSDACGLDSRQRLADLEASGLLDSSAIAALEAITEAAHRALGTDTMTLVSAITADDHVVVSVSAEDDAPPIGPLIPLSHSICKHVVMSEGPYIVEDATTDPTHALAVRDYGVGAYLGSPLRGITGSILGTVSAATAQPRQWTARELSILESLGKAAEAVIVLHTAIRNERIARVNGAVPSGHAARVQHDLRTPLTSLIGYLTLVLEDADAVNLTDHQLNALVRCQTNAERLRDAVDYLNLIPAPSGP